MRRRAGRGRAGVEPRLVRKVASRPLLALALAAVVLAAIGASPTSPRAAADGGQVQGVAIDPKSFTTDYARLARMGTNTLYLDIYYEADSPNANSVHPFGSTVDDVTLMTDIKTATGDGLQVFLMPKVWCNGCKYGWRGDLEPSDPHAFMQSYTQMVLKYAQLGQQNGVSLLFLGSEMNHLQAYPGDWRAMATAERGMFHGLITYQPNWDHNQDVSFWDALDLVTVSAYYPLTPTAQPSVAEVKNAWHSSAVPGWKGQNWFAQLQGLANSTGKRVLIGEVGYRSSTTAAEYPWDEWDPATADQTTQANAYQALLETFSPQPWWAGVIWWQWRGTDQDSGSTDMSPKAKQAEEFLTKWWAQGWRPGSGSVGAGGAGGSGSGAAGASGRASVLGARTAGTQGGPGTTGSTSTSPSGEQPGMQAAAGPGLASSDGSSAAIDGPRSVANLAKASDKRAFAVVVSLVALLAMGALWVSMGLRRIHLPHSQPVRR